MTSPTSGKKLCARSWRPSEGNERSAALLLAHGYAAHSGFPSQRLLAEHCAMRGGIPAFSLDAEGHGDSQGQRGRVKPLEQMAADLVALAERVAGKGGELEGARVFFGGVSLGGAVALRASWERPDLCAGLVLLSPLVELDPSQQPPQWQIPLLRAAACLMPGLPAIPTTSNDPTMHFRDQALVQEAASDPLQYRGSMRLGSAKSLLEAMRWAKGAASHIDCPFIVLHGTNDSVVPIGGSRRLHRLSPSRDKELKESDGLHGVLCDPPAQREELLCHLVDWLVTRAGPNGE